MADKAEKKRPKTFFDNFKFWKSKKKSARRRSLPKLPDKELENENKSASLPRDLNRRGGKQDGSNNKARPISLTESGYATIPAAHLVIDDHTYIEVIDVDRRLKVSEVEVPGLEEENIVYGACRSEEDKLRERKRITELLLKQKVSDKTLYVNYEEPPEIPLRSPVLTKRATKVGSNVDPEKEQARISGMIERQKDSDTMLYFNSEEPPTVPQRKSKSYVDAADGASLPFTLDEKPEEQSADTAQFAVDEDTAKAGDPLDESGYITASWDEPESGTIPEEQNKEENNLHTAKYRKSKIKIQIEPPRQTYVCVRGLSEKTNLDTLCNFLEVKAGNPVDSDAMVQGESGMVVVPFTNEIDFYELSEALNQRPLDNSILEVCQIQKLDSAVVSSDDAMPSDEDLQHYCESNFGDVVSCSNMDNDMKMVSFDDNIDITGLCLVDRHEIKGKSVVISPLYECEFGKVWDKNLHTPICIPTDIQLIGLNPSLETLICSSKTLVSLLDSQLETYFAKVSHDDNDRIIIKCLLTKSTLNAKTLSESWEREVEAVLEKSIDEIILKGEIAIPNIHVEGMKTFKQTLEQNYGADVLLTFHQRRHQTVLEILGLENIVQEAVTDINSILDIPEEAKDDNSIVYEKFDVPTPQLSWLEEVGFLDEIGISEDVIISSDLKKGQVLVVGEQDVVMRAKNQINSEVSQFHSWILNDCSENQKKLLQNHSVWDVIKNTLKDRDVNVEFEISEDEEIRAFSTTSDAKVSMAKVINNCIVETTIPTDERALQVIILPEWVNFVAGLTNEHDGKVIIRPDDSGYIRVSCLKDELQGIMDEINGTLLKLKPKQEITSLSQSIVEAYGYDVQEEKQKDNSVNLPNGTTIRFIYDEIGKQETDVVVCTVSCDMSLSMSATGKNLLKYGGQGLQDECNQLYPTGIEFGDLACVGGGQLKCKYLYLGALPPWSKEETKDTKILSKFVKQCLDLASEKGAKTMAFSAMGTGALSYPPEAVAQMMYDCVINFDSGLSDSSRSLFVTFVIYYSNEEVYKILNDLDMQLNNLLVSQNHLKVSHIPLITKRLHTNIWAIPHRHVQRARSRWSKVEFELSDMY